MDINGVVSRDGQVVGTIDLTCPSQWGPTAALDGGSSFGSNGWVSDVLFTANSSAPGANYGQYVGVSGYWNVPPLPPSGGDCLAIWLGLWSTSTDRILQPILVVDCGTAQTPNQGQWYIEDYYFNAGTVTNTPPIAVDVGDQIDATVAPLGGHPVGQYWWYQWIGDERLGTGASWEFQNSNQYWQAVPTAVLETPGGTGYEGIGSCADLPSNEIEYFYNQQVYEQDSNDTFGDWTQVTATGTWKPMAAGTITDSPYCNYTADHWYGDYYYGNWGYQVSSLLWTTSTAQPPQPTGCVPAGTSVSGYPAIYTDGPNCCGNETLWTQNSVCYYVAGAEGCQNPGQCISGSCSNEICGTGAITAACGSTADCTSPAGCWPPTEICLLPGGTLNCSGGDQCLSGTCDPPSCIDDCHIHLPSICALSNAGEPCLSNSDCSSGLVCDNAYNNTANIPGGPFSTWTCVP